MEIVSFYIFNCFILKQLKQYCYVVNGDCRAPAALAIFGERFSESFYQIKFSFVFILFIINYMPFNK